jgi:hypothetical protein
MEMSLYINGMIVNGVMSEYNEWNGSSAQDEYEYKSGVNQ